MEFYGHIQATDHNAQETLVPVTSDMHVQGVTAGTHTAEVTYPDGRFYRLNETITARLASIDALRNAYLSAISGVPRVTTVEAKAASYTISSSDSGKLLTTRGASGAITFTLPTMSASYTGVDVLLFNAVDQDMIVSAQTAGQIMFKNDLAANSVSYETAGEQIGGAFRVISDGTSWLVMPLAEEATTITVVT
jgi:hypothetical protein